MAGYQGKIDSISVAADDGVSPTELKTRVADTLRGDSVAVRTGKEEADRQANDLQDQLSFLQTGLLVFAGIAVFVGAFVIYNTFSITVAQRTRELALLRTLGASRRQVLRSIVLEALVIGFGAAVVGLLGGLLIAQGLQALFKAVGADLPDTGSVIKSRTIIVALLVGTVVTVIASLAPALRSTRIAPVVALREGLVEQRGGGRVRTIIAVLLGVLGVALLLDRAVRQRVRRFRGRAHGPRRARRLPVGRDAQSAPRAPARGARRAAAAGGLRDHRAPRPREHAAQSRPHRGDRRGAHDRRGARRVRGDLRRRPARLDRPLRRRHVPRRQPHRRQPGRVHADLRAGGDRGQRGPGRRQRRRRALRVGEGPGRHRHDAGHRHRHRRRHLAVQGGLEGRLRGDLRPARRRRRGGRHQQRRRQGQEGRRQDRADDADGRTGHVRRSRACSTRATSRCSAAGSSCPTTACRATST